MILAGDVGGTKTALALFEGGGGGLIPVREAVLPSGDFPGLEAAAARFLAEGPAPRLRAACFGVAGPVVDGRCVTTNLPWELDERALERALGAPRVRLLNDLEAAAHGVLALPAGDLEVLQAGTRREGNRVLIAAGTGLGEALMIWDGRRHRVVASEGGHADFAPRTDLEAGLLRHLRGRFGHVSWERVLSGPGLVNVYGFLRATEGGGEPEWLRQALGGEDPPAAVAEAALAGRDARCARALDLFVAAYGAEAGNLALKALALGGVFVGGGIAPKIRAALTDGRFLRAFADKGRFAGLMASLPVSLVLNPQAPLLGAASVAAQLADG